MGVGSVWRMTCAVPRMQLAESGAAVAEHHAALPARCEDGASLPG